ncbi:hypothetical protein G7072_08950 [Nocardioides sp. HDW12B]|uniref:hypothetical protein n=1 Tax=Nocardioides sp. HDW12B TaxID=2714939 RepID=UPI001408FE46|nr:hypothetical protein [Nocardioides sp. HDW12B]QIK66460.1 hypothetical protein G7072_08950 [Nocardioides sp. HDW12B]
MRRVLAVVVGVVVVGLVAVLTAVLVGRGDASQDVARPAEQRPPRGLVLRGDDAATAVEGEDYVVLRQVPGRIGYQAEVLLPDGALVLQERFRTGPDFRDLPDLVRVWRPGTGDSIRLPTPWGPRARLHLTATGTDHVWVSWNERRGGRWVRSALRLDRRTGDTTTYVAPRVPRARSPHLMGVMRPGGDGRLYFMTGDQPCVPYDCPRVDRRELWSFEPGRAGSLRQEGEGATEFAVSDRLLAYAVYDGESSVVRVRRLDGDRVHEARLRECPLATDDVEPSVLAGDDVVLAGCGVVLDDRARVLARLELTDHDLRGVSDRRWVAYGRTVYDAASGRLLRVADERRWEDRAVLMQGDQVLFPSGTTPPSTTRGTWTLARLAG